MLALQRAGGRAAQQRTLPLSTKVTIQLMRSSCTCQLQAEASQHLLHHDHHTTSLLGPQVYGGHICTSRGYGRWRHDWHFSKAGLSTLAAKPSKVVPFKLADIGEGIHEVELLQWFVKEGDQVKQFDRICEVQSDKATVEISSRYDGVITVVHHPVGSHVKVGAPLVDIEVPQVPPEAVPPTLHNDPSLPPPVLLAKSPTSTPPVTATTPSAPLRDKDDITLTTPAVRRLAKEYNVDLSYVPATGPKGRVLKSDMLEHLKKLGKIPPTTPSTPSPLINAIPSTSTIATPVTAWAPSSIQPSPVPAATSSSALLNGVNGAKIPGPALASPSPSAAPSAPLQPPVLTPSSPSPTPITKSRRVPIQGFMKIMVKTMTASLKIPHFAYKDEVVMDKLVELRDNLRPAAEAQGIKLTYLPLMIKAASLALNQYPILNSSLSTDETELIFHGDHNIGVAIDTSKGLLVPVIKQCQNKSIIEIAKDLNDYQALAKTANFNESQLTGGTFTLSNIGNIGGTYTNPVIVPPQVAIGAVGKIQRLPRFVNDESMAVTAVKVMQVSWSADHRVVDGATMARFSNAWKAYLENPALMLAHTK